MATNPLFADRAPAAISITVRDCSCPICGAAEVEDASLPIMEQKLQVRGFKVHRMGMWWSECLLCKAEDGNGWFATETDGSIVIEPSRIATMRAKGHQVTELPEPEEV